MPLWLVGLAAIAEACSYIGGGYLLKVILSHEEYHLAILLHSWWRGSGRDISVVVVLAYRLVSFWIPTLLGLIAIRYIQKAKKGSTEC